MQFLSPGWIFTDTTVRGKNYSCPLPHYIQEINLNYIVDVKRKAKNIQSPEEIIGGNHCDLVVGKEFLSRTQKSLTIKVDKLDFAKIKKCLLYKRHP